MARREARHSGPQLLLIWVGANIDGVHDLAEAHGVEMGRVAAGSEGDVGLADIQEVGPQTAGVNLDDDLEEGAQNDRVQDAEDAVVEVPEAADAYLGDQDDGDGDQGRENARESGRDEPASFGVG